MELILTRKAQNDLDAIEFYTLQKWAFKQTEQYLLSIENQLSLLLDNKMIGVKRPDICKGCRVLTGSHHLIIYEILGDNIVIMAMPHKRSDILMHMQEHLS